MGVWYLVDYLHVGPVSAEDFFTALGLDRSLVLGLEKDLFPEQVMEVIAMPPSPERYNCLLSLELLYSLHIKAGYIANYLQWNIFFQSISCCCF